MNGQEEQKRYLEAKAEEILGVFDNVASAAARAITSYAPPTLEVGSRGDFNATAVHNQLVRSGNQRFADDQVLQREPAIARVRAKGPGGQFKTYYVARVSPPSPALKGTDALFVSYRAPVGRVASVEAGGFIELPNLGEFEVLERALLRPVHDGAWDSRDSVVETIDFGPLTVQSLRKLLAVDLVEEDLRALAELLKENAAAENVLEGLRRAVVTKMALRDQPVLDKFQDEIFRLPLSNRLLILGAPGTGKTTTLIRRLGQKLDLNHLEEEEKAAVQRAEIAGEIAHGQSWLMFTPTDLLKQYVKEAFAREGIAASEQRITTWTDHRRELARGMLSVLRTNTGSGIFVLKDSLDTLLPEARTDLIAWFEDFNRWQRERAFGQFAEAANELSQNSDAELAAMGREARDTLSRLDSKRLEEVVVALVGGAKDLQERVAALKAQTDRRIDESLNIQVNRNRAFLDEFARFLGGLRDAGDSTIDESEDGEVEDEEEVARASTSRGYAMARYRRFARGQARAVARKRSIGKETMLGKIGAWVGERGLKESVRGEVGASLLIQARARQLASPIRRVFNGAARRYREFRRLRQAEGRWYRESGFSGSDINALEVDAVLLALLQPASILMRRIDTGLSQEFQEWGILRSLRSVRRNQILVDETTDFSPIQLACMASLMHPATRSFFSCGDFNQRLTTWGSRDLGQVEWAVRGISSKTINVSYRQTKELNGLARALALIGGSPEGAVVLPEHVENNGVPPVLAEQQSEAAIVKWLGERIREIEALTKLPSIAVLVPEESVAPALAQALNEELTGVNIRVVAYLDGQAIGPENDIRVFDVQHIKGLEFEAVFFVGVDRLAERHPELFDKYLYVGATRAATYFGMTCEGKLPQALESLRPTFAVHW